MTTSNSFHSLISKLGHPIPANERLSLIIETCGSTFTENLQRAAMGDVDADNYVKTVLKCASKFCETTLRNAALSHSFREILTVGLSQGSTFFRALNTLAKNEDEADVALTYMMNHFETIDILPTSDPDRLPNMSQFYPSKDDLIIPAIEMVAESAILKKDVPPVHIIEPILTQQVQVKKPQPQPQPQRPPQPQPEHDASPLKTNREYSSCHAYGTQYAMCFGEGLAADLKTHILNIDGAPAESPRKYDWSRKIAVQLTMEEMYRMLAVLQLKLASVKFMGHGQQHDKILSFTAQPENGCYYATLGQTGRKTMSVQISAGVGVSISTMILKQIFLNSPHLSKCTIDELLNTIVKLDIAAIEHKNRLVAA